MIRCQGTHVLMGEGGEVVVFRLSWWFIQLWHWREVLHQNSSQFIVKLALNLLQSLHASKKTADKHCKYTPSWTLPLTFFLAVSVRTCSRSIAWNSISPFSASFGTALVFGRSPGRPSCWICWRKRVRFCARLLAHDSSCLLPTCWWGPASQSLSMEHF